MSVGPDEIVAEMLDGAWEHLRAELATVTFDALNESVFRYFCIRELAKIPELRYEMEWRRRVDLYVDSKPHPFAVEFKFYCTRRHSDGRAKGGPSKKNLAEFVDSWRKHASICSECDSATRAYVVLV